MQIEANLTITITLQTGEQFALTAAEAEQLYRELGKALYKSAPPIPSPPFKLPPPLPNNPTPQYPQRPGTGAPMWTSSPVTISSGSVTAETN